jgi:hypothetical protein
LSAVTRGFIIILGSIYRKGSALFYWSVVMSSIDLNEMHMNSVTVVDGSGKQRHYIFGGLVGDYELWGNVATMYEYIATTNTWIKRQNMPF